MGYADVRHIATDSIPVIDLAPIHDGGLDGMQRVAAEMRAAAETVGFFYVRNHGIDAAVFDDALAASQAFFRRPLEDKLRSRINHHHRGFLRVGEAKMYDNARVDLKESFVFGMDIEPGDPAAAGNPFLGPNNWPDDVPGFREAICRFYDAGNAVGLELMRVFAVGMGLPADNFFQKFDRPISRGSLIYYPPQPPDLGEEQFGVAPHTDYGVLTVLWQDQTGGLEVLGRDGEWIFAEPIPDTLVLNVGDLLARWTNDAFRSTPHRVVNRSGRERFALGMFVDPNYETVVDPAIVCGPGETPRYPPVTVGDHIKGRLDKAFAYRAGKAG